LVDMHIEKAGLGGVRDSMPSTLSGGEKQRCALLRSALNRPELLLLDEPFSALDGDNRRTLHSLVCELREEMNFTLIIVSHDPCDIRKLADRVIELSEGRVERDEPKERYFRTAKNERTELRLIRNPAKKVIV